MYGIKVVLIERGVERGRRGGGIKVVFEKSGFEVGEMGRDNYFLFYKIPHPPGVSNGPGIQFQTRTSTPRNEPPNRLI